jgi:hypothetical protein
MGDKVVLGLYDAVGKLCEVVEVDEDCISISAEGKVSVLADAGCEEVWEVLRGWDVRVIDGDEDTWEMLKEWDVKVIEREEEGEEKEE